MYDQGGSYTFNDCFKKLKPHLSLVFNTSNFCQCSVRVLIMYFLGIHLINMPENDSQPPINRCCYVGVVPCMVCGQNWLMLSGDSFNQLLCFVFFLHSSSAINFKFVASKSFFVHFQFMLLVIRVRMLFPFSKWLYLFIPTNTTVLQN